MSYWIIVVMMCFLVASFLTTRFMIGGVPALFTKTIASLGFVFAAILAMIYVDFEKYYAFVIVGLIFGMLGDILLDLKRLYTDDKAVYLNYGMLVFALGHIMYFMALGNYYGFNGTFIGETFISLAVGLAVSALIVFVVAKYMKLDFGEFKWQSFAYSTVLVAVMTLALITGIKNNSLTLMNIGLVAFFLSDLVLSTQYFGGKEDSKVLTAINHILYYGAQVLIVGIMY